VKANVARLSLFLVALTASVGAARSQNPSLHQTLRVKVNYTGAGTVDARHRIYVLLFDSNPMTAATLVDASSQSAPPAPQNGVSHIVARQSTPSKNGIITFRNIAVTRVFAMAFYDKAGTYNGHPDSSPGSPMGIYGVMPDKLESVDLHSDKDSQIAVTFDDSKSTP